MGTLFTRARGRDERRFQATRQDVAKALLLFRRTIAALRLAKETGEEGVAVVDREVGMKKLNDVLPVIGSVANVAEQDILITAAERYGVLRRFSPRFLKAFDFRSGTSNDPVLAAIELLKGMDRDSTRALPDRPPSTFKQEIGLDHYEGRGWRGFHHHASLCIAAYGFLAAERCLPPPQRQFIRKRIEVPALPEDFRPRGSAHPA